jgi:hypothetical protein
MAKPIHSAQRQVQALTLGVAKSQRKVRERERELGFAETEQQYQFPISGYVGPTAAFITTEILFDFPFYYAPGQRDPDFANPHFWFGAEARPAVAVSVTVTDWLFDDDNGAIIGAHVAIGVCGNVPNATPYTGTAHLTFQGFSALAEDEADFDDVGLVE